jgi:hypothetical protein
MQRNDNKESRRRRGRHNKEASSTANGGNPPHNGFPSLPGAPQEGPGGFSFDALALMRWDTESPNPGSDDANQVQPQK